MSALQFLIPDDRPAAELEASLERLLHLQFEPAERVERRYYDSFDWRLYHRDLSLEAEPIDDANRLRLFDLFDDSSRATLRVIGEPPRFATDYPAGAMRENLEPILEMRALLPVVSILARTRRVRVLNKDEKTVVRMVIEEARYHSPDGAVEGVLGHYLRLIPVRGYDKALQRTRTLMEKELGIEPAIEHPMLRAAELSGKRVGAYSSKLDFRLSPKRRADLVAKEIHLHLLNVLEANIEGTKADLDTEFLHDLRVATRRIRSALTQIKGVFEPELVERFKAEFAWIQEITGRTRDMDVYLLKFDDYRDSLPDWVQPDLAPFHSFLVEHRAEEQRRLVKALESERFRHIIEEWRGYCEAPVPERGHL
ncbi:MAG TPA: CHAD domain-containing protein, partial [Chromatiales bacterium]|nr:CHAD domain-containing protein [Chromatiales bacterium]